MDAGGQLSAVAAAAFPQAEAIAAIQDAHFPTPSTDEDCDDLYGDVNLGLGFLPLPPPSPASPTSPPKTPSPGCSIPSPSPPPRRTPPPKPQPEPQPKPTPQHQPPPLPAPKPTRRHQPLQRASSGDYTSLPTTALYIGELPWWTTDAEVEAALAPHGALHGLHFYADKLTGKSCGFCRADFLHPAAAASAGAVLHGRAFGGRHCVASLSSPPALHRSDANFHVQAPAPNPTRGRGGNASNVSTARGNVGPVLGDRPALASLPRPMAPRPRVPPFGGMMGGGVGYGGFPSMGQCNAGMVTAGMMPSVVAPHVNPAFLAAGGMAMGGPGVWHDQRMAGGLWGGQQPWNFGGCEMSLQQLRPPLQHHQAQQQYRNGDYEKERGMGRERPGSRNGEMNIGNVRGYPERRQCGRDRDGGDWSRNHDREERGGYREYVLEKERDRDRNCNGRVRRRGDKRRYQEYTERDDYERRGRAKSRSQSSDGDDDDDLPMRRCCASGLRQHLQAKW